MTATIEPLLLTISQTTAALSLPRTTIYQLLGRGDIETVKIGRRTMVPRDSLHRFIAAQPSAKIAAPARKVAA